MKAEPKLVTVTFPPGTIRPGDVIRVGGLTIATECGHPGPFSLPCEEAPGHSGPHKSVAVRRDR